MGLGGISIWQLLIILLFVVMIFGTKRLKNIGSDLGGAVKGFKKAMDDDTPADEKQEEGQKSINSNAEDNADDNAVDTTSTAENSRPDNKS